MGDLRIKIYKIFSKQNSKGPFFIEYNSENYMSKSIFHDKTHEHIFFLNGPSVFSPDVKMYKRELSKIVTVHSPVLLYLLLPPSPSGTFTTSGQLSASSQKSHSGELAPPQAQERPTAGNLPAVEWGWLSTRSRLHFTAFFYAKFFFAL